MTIINREHIDQGLVAEDSVHKFTAFASDLGIGPCGFPLEIQTTLGNKMPFMLMRFEERDGDLMAINYRQSNGCIELRVFND